MPRWTVNADKIATAFNALRTSIEAIVKTSANRPTVGQLEDEFTALCERHLTEIDRLQRKVNSNLTI